MADHLLRELESAAHVLLSPPNVVTSEQRHSAESVFINFRKMNSPYELCKHILDTTKIDYVLFEAAGLIQEAGLREWSYMASTDVDALRNYLLRYVVEKPTLAPFVREKMLQVIAVMIKRGSIEDRGAAQGQLLQEVKQLISNGSLPQQLVGCGIIAAMIQEYEISGKSTDIGLSRDDHFSVRKRFQDSDLKEIFVFIIRALQELIKRDSPQQLMKHVLSISASVLSWDFRCQRPFLYMEFSRLNNPRTMASAPESWKDIFIDSDMVTTFFEVYWKVRTDPQLAHHAMTCLTQLAAMRGPEGCNTDCTAYYSTFLQAAFNLLDNVKILDREATGIALIFHNAFPLVGKLPPDLISNYLDHLTNITCLFSEGAAEEESMCVENTYYMEAYTQLLLTWLNVSKSFTHHSPYECLSLKDFKRNMCTAAVKVVETYLQCHLFPPIGVRGLGREIEAEEIDELDEDDREKFVDQLQCLGALSRLAPEHVLPLLARLMEDCTGRIYSQLQRMSTQAVQISDHRIMENLSEDIHWLILLAGHTLTMDATGEVPLIPSEIMQYSIKQFDSVDTDITLKVLTSPEQYVHNIPGAEESMDHVVRVVAAVFRLCELERRAFEAKLENFMSPQVGCTIMWFLNQWSLSYLLPNERDYSYMSVPIMTAFGSDTEGAAWVTNFLLNKIESNLKHASAEPDLVKDTVKTLVAFVNSDAKASYVLKTQGFAGIMNLQELCASGAFPQHAKRGYFEALIQADRGFDSRQDSENYIRKVAEPTLTKFKALIGQENFVRNFHEAQNINTFVSCFDSFIGMARGSHGRRAVNCFGMFIIPVISELPSLIGLYANYSEIVEIILEMLCETAKNMILYLNQESTKLLNTASVQTIQTFAKFNSNRFKLMSTTEDDTFRDIELILKLLSSLVSKDFCDFSFDDTYTNRQTSEAVISGLNLIMPLMNADILKCPVLCMKFYQTLSFVSEVSYEKMAALPEDLLRPFLSAIEMGLRAFIPEIQFHCFKFLGNLLKAIPSVNGEAHPLYNYLRPFFHITFDLVVFQKCVSDRNLGIHNTFYKLISTYQEDFKEAVRSAINSQTNPAVAERLEAAFTHISVCVPTPGKRYYVRFVEAFDSFLAAINGMSIK